jgi:hypothetical protein
MRPPNLNFAGRRFIRVIPWSDHTPLESSALDEILIRVILGLEVRSNGLPALFGEGDVILVLKRRSGVLFTKYTLEHLHSVQEEVCWYHGRQWRRDR